MKEMWDARYGEESYIYGKDPNGFFKEQLDLLSPGKILLPAEGEGRNAVYAARQNWLVDAFDYSESGYKKASALAKEMEVNINYEIASFEEFNFKEAYYNAVGLVYCHMPGATRSILHQKVVDSLALGGIIILEAFHTSQLGNDTGGPQSIEYLFDEQMLSVDFKGMNIELLEVLKTPLYEGLYHNGEASVIRCVAVKQ